MTTFRLRLAWIAGLMTLLPLTAAAQPAQPSVLDALRLKPIQPGIECDSPEADTAAKCTLTPLKSPPLSGWEVRSPNGDVLRRFLDTNGDNKVDQWCYFQDGIEVYRDIDSNFNKKADAYRWMGTAGTRWALDTNEDGQIDRWQVLSPEELSEEVVSAMSARNADGFRRLLLSEEELRGLQLGQQQTAQLGKKLAAAATGLEDLLRSQSFVGRDARWVNFGGTRPGIVPAGTDGSQRDLQVYENAVAVIETDAGHNQVILGTLVRSGEAWRLIDLPKSIADAQASTEPEGFFFQVARGNRAEADVPVVGGVSQEFQDLIHQLEEIDNQLKAGVTPEELAPLNARRADILGQLADKSTAPDDKVMWLRQLADTVSAAAQAGSYPEGLARLEGICQRLRDEKADPELLAYVTLRFMNAGYSQSLQDPDADLAKVQTKWITDLEQFVTEFAATKDAAEAMLSLAIAEEFGGHDDKAVGWYTRIVQECPDTPAAQKAAGAKRRIESVGQPAEVRGTDSTGKPFDIASLRGSVVIVHYWANWAPPSIKDISVLKDMQAKYGKDKVALVGINIDYTREALDAYLAENPLTWPQLFEPGGLDSPLANAWGILTLPAMLLIDKEGKVVSRNLQAGEIDTQLRGLLR